mmetsp:Transcript_69505/g.214844  ORF Transcript_69505/g.214844 Transcript_69505/m.214844 type:complete len:568 (-) Transcript_69505:1040-2743(-)
MLTQGISLSLSVPLSLPICPLVSGRRELPVRGFLPGQLHAPLLPQLLEVRLLHSTEVSIVPVGLLAQVLHLIVVRLQFGCHLLHVLGLLLQVLAVPGQLLRNFWTRLPGNDVLQLHIKLLLLLDQRILLHDLLCLCYQELLQGLHLLDHLVGGWIRTLQLSPPVYVHGILQLLLQSLRLGLLPEKRLVQVMDLPLQALDVGDLGLRGCHVVLGLPDLCAQAVDLLHALLVLDLALLQSALLDLYLLIQQCQLLVAAYQLRSKDVALPDDTFQLLLLSLPLLLSFLDCAFQLLQLRALGLDYVHQVPHPALRLLLRVFKLLIQLLHVELAEVAVHETSILLPDLLLQGRRLVEHDLELPSHLVDLLVGLDEVLGVQVPVHAHGIVEVFLLIALCLDVCDLLLELRQLHASSLELLLGTEVLGISLGQLDAVLLALLLQVPDALPELLRVLLPPRDVLLHVHRLRLLTLHQVDLLLRALIGLDHVLVEDVPLSQKILDLLSVDIAVALQSVRLLLAGLDLSLELVAGRLHILALFIEAPVLLLQSLVHLEDLLALRVVPLDVVPPCPQS